MIKFYIPNNLNLEEHIKQYPTTDIKPFKIIKLAYIIDILTSHMNVDLVDGYKNLNAEILKTRIDNYNKYLSYLVWTHVLESDNLIIPGEKSRAYRFTIQFQTKVKEVEYSDFAFEKNLRNRKGFVKRSLKGPKYLNKFYNDKLKIDERAFEINEVIYKLKMNNDNLLDYDYKNKKMKNPLKQRNSAYKSMMKIKNVEHNNSRDKTSKRYHSNLSRLSDILRNFITYNGKKIVSIDLVNSQPYFSNRILDYKFWKDEKKIKKGDKINYELIKNLYRNYNKKIIIKSNLLYIMLRTIAESVDSKGVERYAKLVVEGELYEYIENESNKWGEKIEGRKAVKQIVFFILFSSNRQHSEGKTAFKKIFPEVYKVFAEIKKGDKKEYKFLSILLQRLESYLFIDVICKRIAKEYPEALMITIHDSIATTYEYEDVVSSIISEELEKATGHIPQLKFDYWLPQKAEESLMKLKLRAKKY